MKYLKKYEDFQQQEFAVGDIVKLKNGEAAKITKINTKNSYLIKMMVNTQFEIEEIEIRIDQIEGLIQSNDRPAYGTEMMKKSKNDPSNDLVINGGYPDTPIVNIFNR